MFYLLTFLLFLVGIPSTAQEATEPDIREYLAPKKALKKVFDGGGFEGAWFERILVPVNDSIWLKYTKDSAVHGYFLESCTSDELCSLVKRGEVHTPFRLDSIIEHHRKDFDKTESCYGILKEAEDKDEVTSENYEIVNNSQRIETPAGTFDCIVLCQRKQLRGERFTEALLYYARDIGLVHFERNYNNIHFSKGSLKSVEEIKLPADYVFD